MATRAVWSWLPIRAALSSLSRRFLRLKSNNAPVADQRVQSQTQALVPGRHWSPAHNRSAGPMPARKTRHGEPCNLALFSATGFLALSVPSFYRIRSR